MKLQKSRWKKAFFIPLILLLIFTILLSVSIGPVDISPVKVARIILSRVPLIGGFLPQYTGSDARIVLLLRLPRVLFGMVVGMSLAVSGCSMQGVFKNPMASPFILGVSSGGAVGAALGIFFGLSIYLLPVLAFVTAMLTAFVVFLLGRVRGMIHISTLLLAGLAMNFLMSSLFSYILFQADPHDMNQILSFLWGTLGGSLWDHFYITLPCMVIGTAGVYAYSRELNVMQTGEESAKQLGVEVERTKIIQIIAASFLTAAVISFSGVIGFVGLIIPHIARLVVGPDHRILVPTSSLLGAIFLIGSDTISRVGNVPVGIITGLLGAPFFILLLVRKRGETGW